MSKSIILTAFHNKKSVQKKCLDRLQEHYKLDEIIKGQYWEDGKGCAVGCVLHSSNHEQAEDELGIPEWFMRLMDILFQGISDAKCKEFPLNLFKSIPLGFDKWQHLYHQLCVFMLEKICKNTDNKLVVNAICDIITLHKIESKDESAWSVARSAVESTWSVARSVAESTWSVDESTRSVARSAAESTRSVDESTRSATWSAAMSVARSVAESTRSVAESTRSVDESTRSATWSAESTARSAAYKSIADKLVELLENEKQ